MKQKKKPLMSLIGLEKRKKLGRKPKFLPETKNQQQMKFQDLLQHIAQTHTELHTKAAQSVNQLLTIRNWCIGAYIVEYEQNGNDRAKYGEQLFTKLANELKAIKGLGRTELKKFRKLYLTYPLLHFSIGQNLLPAQIRQTMSVELQNAGNEEIEFVQQLLQRVSYSHLCVLMTVENPNQRRSQLPTEEQLQNFILNELKKR